MHKKLFLLLIFTLLFQCIHSRIVQYNNEKYAVSGDKSFISSFNLGMFGKDSVLRWLIPGSGDSFASFQLTYTSSVQQQNMSPIQIFFFKSDELDNIFQTENNKFVCEDGKMALKKEDETFVHLTRSLPVAQFDYQFKVPETALYTLLVVKCKDKEAMDLTVNGKITFMNPYGHLEGQFFGMMPFQAIVCILYVATAVFWIVSFIKNRRDLLMLQIWISIVLIISLLSSGIEFFETFAENINGSKSLILGIIEIFFALCKKTISRVLVLIVSMGYGSVTTSLGKTSWTVAIYTVAYFIVGCMYEAGRLLFFAGTVDSVALFISVAPAALLEGIFFCITFMALFNTLSQLQQKKQEAKLQLYRRFMYVLAVAVFLSATWSVLQMFFMFSNMKTNYWQFTWIFEAFWTIGFWGILLSIMILWKPSPNNRLYAYAEQIPDSDEGDTELGSVEGGELPAPETHANESDEEEEDGGKTVEVVVENTQQQNSTESEKQNANE